MRLQKLASITAQSFLFYHLAVLLALGLMTGLSLTQQRSGPPAESSTLSAPNTILSYWMPVQGRLTDLAGNPLNGNYNLTFRLYTIVLGGTAICRKLAEIMGGKIHVECG